MAAIAVSTDWVKFQQSFSTSFTLLTHRRRSVDSIFTSVVGQWSGHF